MGAQRVLSYVPLLRAYPSSSFQMVDSPATGQQSQGIPLTSPGPCTYVRAHSSLRWSSLRNWICQLTFFPGESSGIHTFSLYLLLRKLHPTRSGKFRGRARSDRWCGPRIKLGRSPGRHYRRRCITPKRLSYRIQPTFYSNLAETSLKGRCISLRGVHYRRRQFPSKNT